MVVDLFLVIFKYDENRSRFAEDAGVGAKMGFHDEDEIENWYSEQKEKLEEQFMSSVAGKQDSASAKEHYDESLKKLIARYQEEYERLLSKGQKKKS
jgi:hypothetical protein